MTTRKHRPVPAPKKAAPAAAAPAAPAAAPPAPPAKIEIPATKGIGEQQVRLALQAIGRCLPNAGPGSRISDMIAYGLMYELMGITGLHFADDAAAAACTPPDTANLREGAMRAAAEQFLRQQGVKGALAQVRARRK